MSSALYLAKRRTEHTSREWGHGAGMVATHRGTRRPYRHFVDYVVGSKVDRLELQFGPAMGQI
jgi:hypothetical protein